MKKPRELSTTARIEQYGGLKALLETWELRPDEERIREHDYILELKRRLIQVRNYILHRADKDAIV